MSNNKSRISDAVMAMIGSINVSSNKTLPKSLNDSTEDTRSHIEDAYSNSLLGIGKNDKVEEYTKYGFSNDTLNFFHWLSLYNDSWVFRRAIDKPAQDMIRQGVKLIGTTSDKLDNVYKRFNKMSFNFTQLYQWGRLFGGSVMVILFDNVNLNQMYQSMSMFFDNGKLNKNSVMSAYITDRWYGLQWSDEVVTNMKDSDFGKPKHYTVTFADGKQYRIHHSWILRYEHRIAPKLIKLGMLQGWGYAEGAHIINELNRDEKLKNSIQSLINKSLIEVIQMSGMRGVFMGADQDNEQQLKKRLEMVNWGRNFNSLTFLDKDDSYTMNTFPGLSGLSDILQQNMWMVAAALDMQGILFGDLKGGFSVDENALLRYNDTISNLNNSYAKDILNKFLEICYKLEGIEEEVDFEFNSLVVKKDEDAFRDMNSLGDLMSKGISDGYITPKLAAIALKQYSEQIGLDLPIDDTYLKELDDKVLDEDEDLEKAFESEDENTYQSDAFLNDLTHVYSIEKKYMKKYPNLRVVWYEVDAKYISQGRTDLTPSLYIFHDKYPIGRGSDAARYSIRFSDHKPRHETYKSFIITPYDRATFEREAEKFIANNAKLMEELYG